LLLHSLQPILAGMAKKPELPEPSWAIYKVVTSAVWLGTVEAPTDVAAIEKAAQEFKTDVRWLHAVPRR
jgi:hypothetical protein